MNTTTTSVPTDIHAIPLNLADRCDRCGAQAFVRASITVRDTQKLVDLLFCGHHYTKHRDTLTNVAVHVQDDTKFINEKPSSSA